MTARKQRWYHDWQCHYIRERGNLYLNFSSQIGKVAAVEVELGCFWVAPLCFMLLQHVDGGGRWLENVIKCVTTYKTKTLWKMIFLEFRISQVTEYCLLLGIFCYASLSLQEFIVPSIGSFFCTPFTPKKGPFTHLIGREHVEIRVPGESLLSPLALIAYLNESPNFGESLWRQQHPTS